MSNSQLNDRLIPNSPTPHSKTLYLRSLLLPVVLVLLALAFSCARKPNDAQQQNRLPIKIGYFGDLTGPTFNFGSPSKVFDAKYVESNPSRHYDVSPDGQRFLMIKDSASTDPNATPVSMIVVLNWFEELKAAVRVR